MTYMEGASVAEDRLTQHEEHSSLLASGKRVAELDRSIAELRQIMDSEAKETAAIEKSLRRQLQSYQAESTALIAEIQKLDQRDAERARREREAGERGLMGEVARQQEAKLEVASRRAREARSRASVHATVLRLEIQPVGTS